MITIKRIHKITWWNDAISVILPCNLHEITA